MKTKILYFPNGRSEDDISNLIKELQSGRLKFTFTFGVSLFPTQDVYLIVIVGGANIEHADIHECLRKFIKHSDKHPHNFLVDLPIERLGAGYVKIEGDKLIFYDSSSKYGKYKKNFLSLGDFHVLEVGGVEFQ